VYNRNVHHSKTTAYAVLVQTLKLDRPLGRLRHRQQDNIKMDINGIRLKNTDLIHLV
jgi:hypothetical protein